MIRVDRKGSEVREKSSEKVEKQWSGDDLKSAEERRLERGCHRSLSTCVEEALQCSSEASLLFICETRTSDSRFMLLEILFHIGDEWLVTERRSFTAMN